MANVKVCDRCSKKIETTGVWPIYIKHFRSILDMEDNDYEYSSDLCGDCTKKLFEFMEGKATEAVVEER